MAQRWSSKVCREVHSARRENWNAENPSANVRLVCSNDDKFEAIQDIIMMRRPYPFNKAAVYPNLYAASIQTNADRARFTTDSAEEVIDYTYETFFDVMYTTLNNIALYDGALLSFSGELSEQKGIIEAHETIDPDVEFITFDYRHFFWKPEDWIANPDPNDPAQQNDLSKLEQWDRGSEGGLRLVKDVIHRRVRGYITLPMTIHTWEGATNISDYTSDVLGRTYPENTLLLTDLTIRKGPYNWFYDTLTYELAAKLTYRPDGWDKFPRLKCGTSASLSMEKVLVQCKKEGGGGPITEYSPYPSRDMSEFLFSRTGLFNPDSFIVL